VTEVGALYRYLSCGWLGVVDTLRCCDAEL